MHKRKVKNFPSAPTLLHELTPAELVEFDRSICWCIEELEKIVTRNPSIKQTKDAEATIKKLKDPKISETIKSQLMRQHFGDYKKKIEESKEKQIEVKFGSPESSTSRSVKQRQTSDDSKSSESQSTAFRFNFQTPLLVKEDIVEDSVSEGNTSGFCVPLSDNSFRFNFQLKD